MTTLSSPNSSHGYYIPTPSSITPRKAAKHKPIDFGYDLYGDVDPTKYGKKIPLKRQNAEPVPRQLPPTMGNLGAKMVPTPDTDPTPAITSTTQSTNTVSSVKRYNEPTVYPGSMGVPEPSIKPSRDADQQAGKRIAQHDVQDEPSVVPIEPNRKEPRQAVGSVPSNAGVSKASTSSAGSSVSTLSEPSVQPSVQPSNDGKLYDDRRKPADGQGRKRQRKRDEPSSTTGRIGEPAVEKKKRRRITYGPDNVVAVTLRNSSTFDHFKETCKTDDCFSGKSTKIVTNLSNIIDKINRKIPKKDQKLFLNSLADDASDTESFSKFKSIHGLKKIKNAVGEMATRALANTIPNLSYASMQAIAGAVGVSAAEKISRQDYKKITPTNSTRTWDQIMQGGQTL